MTKSTKPIAVIKPEKPFPGFPLFAHATKRWAKKIRGKFHYFGKWDDPQAALERFNREWPFLSRGQTPPSTEIDDGCTMQVLCNTFLTSKKSKVDSAELSQRTFQDYFATCKLLIDRFGGHRRVDDLRPDDFEQFRKILAARVGIVRLKFLVNSCRIVFRFASDQRLIPQPIYFGQSFNRPPAKALRKARNEAGLRLFEAAEIRRILEEAGVAVKAMSLLGINTGFGNSDVSSLPQSTVDLDSGWIDFPRPKTEIPRHVPLWPETVAALRVAIAERPVPRDPANDGLCFLTPHGHKLVRIKDSGDGRFSTVDMLANHFGRLLRSLGINSRKRLGYYTFRHTFETIAGESKDQVAVNAIMGHVDSTMAGAYRERISDERLLAVTDVVHQWLFGATN